MKTSGLGKGLSALLGSIEKQNNVPQAPIKEANIEVNLQTSREKELREKELNRTANEKILKNRSNEKKQLFQNNIESNKNNKNNTKINQILDESEYQYIKIRDIELNPYQPRKDFDEMAIEELALSISNSGFITPLIVNHINNKYILVAGERRLRACKMLALDKIPAIVKVLSDKQMMQIAIIENVQRKELNSIEEAKAYENMITKLNMEVIELSELLGLPSYYISQKIKLTKLPDSIQQFVSNKDISEGAAIALLKLDSAEAMIAAAKIAVRQHMSRVSVEKLIEKILISKGLTPKTQDFYFRSKYQYISDAFKDSLGWNMKIKPINNGKGKIEIEFLDELNLKEIYYKLEKILR